DGRDATAIIINPAGMVGIGTELDVAISLFSPKRQFSTTGAPSFTPLGTFESSENLFAIPNIAYVREIDATSSWGVSLAANGGMNTNYRNVTNPACVSPPLPATNGVFCGGTTGISLTQALISVGYAKQVGNFKIGVAPIFGFQLFEAVGLLAFAAPTTSINGAALSNVGTSHSTGFGGKIGIEWKVLDNVRIGGVYQTKIKMSEFDEYAGLFADGGDFDIPSNFQVGVSIDVMPNFTINGDFRQIRYTDVGAVSNSTRTPALFGSIGGPGFGWRDIDIFKIGAEYRTDGPWTLRAGYSHNQQPIGSDHVTLNILAPGVVTDHITAGGEYVINDNNSIEFGFMFAPNESVTGIEVTPPAPNPNHFITIEMKQYEATVGWKWKYGN
ncbi:MAG: outer membrane protein transport protein, partial [Robiginitomaculum sp.]|nr:outer membrane protein transport protein [Robiginitomaculum sp.]